MPRNHKTHLLVIDGQVDFMDLPGSALPVAGAVKDMERTAALIHRTGGKLADIHCTLDSHRWVDIAHPSWWLDQRGQQPSPFTMISAADIEAGIWTTRNPGFRKRTLEYAHALEATPSHYKIFIWPPHCLIGTVGASLIPVLNDALQQWSDKFFAMVDYVTKGSNPYTEHYGALMAEVPDPSDPGTQLNTSFLQMLADADMVAVAGEASSHCVLKTVQQIADNIGDAHIRKFHLLRDCMSPVGAPPGGPDFPGMAEAFFRDMKGRGMHITTSTDFLT